ncbi:voltage-gated potassium channel [Russula emetica]|nr:voltage-gated potassium channel [Russula emetica]
MPSTRPSTIPLYSLPLLNSQNAHNGEILVDQPAIGRRTLPDDEDEEEEREVDAEADGEREGEPSSLIIKPEWRLHLYNLLERPNSSAAAVLVHVVVTALIVFSALVTILETVPGTLRSLPGGIWFGLETGLVALFTVEYVARCVATSYSWSGLFGWVVSFFGIMDLLAILPYYIEVALQKDTSTLFRFSILRTFRLLRVFRPFRYNSTLLLTIEVMYLSFRRSRDALLALGFFVLMVVIVFSTLLYFIERGTWDDTLEVFMNSDGDPSQFASIPAAAWYMIDKLIDIKWGPHSHIAISTVGYGEITPRSFFGRLVTLPLLLFGLLLIALPSFVLGREFSIVWNEMASGHTPRAPYMQPRHNFTRSEVFFQSPSLFTRLRTRSDGIDEPLHTNANGTAATTRERGEEHLQLVQSHDVLAAQLVEIRAAMDAQSTLLKRILEREGGSGSER